MDSRTGLVVLAVPLLVLIGCAVASSVLFERKGQSEMVGCLAGLILGPLGLLIAALLPVNQANVDALKLRRGQLKRCPHCAELVQPEARVCRFCGRDLAPDLA